MSQSRFLRTLLGGSFLGLALGTLISLDRSPASGQIDLERSLFRDFSDPLVRELEFEARGFAPDGLTVQLKDGRRLQLKVQHSDGKLYVRTFDQRRDG